MTKEEIEDSKLIAEFMSMPRFQDLETYKLEYSGNYEYHNSWDWQIPVWSKLANLLSDKKYENALDDYAIALLHNKPLEGFRIIVENLKWYNQKQLTKELTPKEKAMELQLKFINAIVSNKKNKNKETNTDRKIMIQSAKRYSLICANEVIKSYNDDINNDLLYWQQVKSEIEKL